MSASLVELAKWLSEPISSVIENIPPSIFKVSEEGAIFLFVLFADPGVFEAFWGI